MALGLTGQFSSQTIQGLSIDQGRHLLLSKKAVPILIGPTSAKSPSPCFSASVIGLIAEVGHNWPQATQFNWQPLEPIRLFSTGVQRFSRPGWIPPGWITFVGQARIHWPHLIHLFKNSSSGSAPGGRMIVCCQLLPNLLLNLRAGTAKVPASRAAA